MFTGIIEEIGTIEKIKKSSASMVLSVSGKRVLEDVKLGDSISINGTCLTVTSFNSRTFTVDVMPETFEHTSLNILGAGAKVNLERAMPANGRFGGHFVTGHIDGTGTIVSTHFVENALYITIEIPGGLSRYFIHRGSVCLDGTSLTVFELGNNTITVSLIPQTRHDTILGSKKVGDIVNVECDMMAKYIYKFMNGGGGEGPGKSDIGTDFLTRHGFME
ncbi:riboflavin synthase [Bacillus salacetis]|uniref:Riboflavin synthase n=1 Tax=Bacillus salacetis TaxID=2315464 RepID=A0A3A1R0Q4_9BACI|nr:riboflavin synthase [Bacillus salacetis]RIW35114.1 riboflavin synthase [Bacillus salacetis]